jgi:hypothetical protein
MAALVWLWVVTMFCAGVLTAILLIILAYTIKIIKQVVDSNL